MGGCCSLIDSEQGGDSRDASTAVDEKPGKKKGQNSRPARSASMQSLWATRWLKVIGDRTASRMEAESATKKCGDSSEECNCTQRAVFVMNMYRFWNDRKHIELDIDHIVQVITTELNRYSSEQMLKDFTHLRLCHETEDLYQLFVEKCKGCAEDKCAVLQRKNVSDEPEENDEVEARQRTSTFARANEANLRIMDIIDDYHCLFFHKIKVTASHEL